MRNVGILEKEYAAVSERIIRFLTDHSGVEYVEGSEKVVEGGAYTLSTHGTENEALQSQLRMDYVTLVERSREMLERQGNKHLLDFERSSETVLGYIRQNSMIWVPSLKAVADSIQAELNLQVFLITQTS